MSEPMDALISEIFGKKIAGLFAPLVAPRTDNVFDRLFRGHKRQLARSVLEVINRLEEFWPLSLRQAYYQCVAGLLVPNNVASYRQIMDICKRLRIEEILPWRAMEDRGRRTSDKRGLSGLEEFLRENLEPALNWRYYHRCHLKGQSNYVEVSVEKDALYPLVEEACWLLCTRVTSVKGQCSVTTVERMASRFDAAMQRGQTPILLHYGDLDPTGVQIPLSLKKAFLEVHALDVEVVQCALTPEQVVEYGLPQDVDPEDKSEDPNYQRWQERFPGQTPTELDALHPKILQELVRSDVLDCYDESLMDEQKEQEQEDDEVLKLMRRSMLGHLRAKFPEQMSSLADLR